MKHNIVPRTSEPRYGQRVAIRCSCGWKATAKYGYRDTLVRRFSVHVEKGNR